MSSIVANQRTAFLARAQDDARRLIASLNNLSDPQRAAMLAIIAAATSTPVDVVLFTSEPGDREEIASTLAGHLLRDHESPDAYVLGNGCLFQVVAAPGTETHHE